MKRLIAIAVVGLTVFNAAAQQSGEIPIELSKPGERGTLIVDIHRGQVKVTGTSRKNVLLKYSVQKGKDCEDCGEERDDGLKKLNSATANLEVSEQNNTVKIDTDWGSKGIDVEIEVPVEFNVRADSYNSGDITVSNISGEVELDNYNGAIYAQNISGSVIADTYNGKIVVVFDRVKADTPMAFSTYNGDVDLTLPATFKASLKMRTARGEILTGFDVETTTTEPVTEKTKNGSQKVYLDEWVRGNVNGGGPEFMIKNYNGDIYLRKK